jgi:peptidoglycan/xylan/chitin deacetylase (PgdA/CDA1 family)
VRSRRFIVGGLIAVIGLPLAAVGVRTVAHARSFQLFGQIVPRVATARMIVALTFDDGPNDAVVDSIITILAVRGVHATFFVVGNELVRAPKAAAKLLAAGHELGNHSYSHRPLAFMSPGRIRSEVVRTDSAIRARGYKGAILFRPPYGVKLIGLPRFLARSGRPTIMWDIEPDSYADVAATSDGIVRHVLERVRPGSIIVLHIWYPKRSTSLHAVGPLIDSLQARGYFVGSAGDLLNPNVKSGSPD